jgi:hypothetical protein
MVYGYSIRMSLVMLDEGWGCCRERLMVFLLHCYRLMNTGLYTHILLRHLPYDADHFAILRTQA